MRSPGGGSHPVTGDSAGGRAPPPSPPTTLAGPGQHTLESETTPCLLLAALPRPSLRLRPLPDCPRPVASSHRLQAASTGSHGDVIDGGFSGASVSSNSASPCRTPA